MRRRESAKTLWLAEGLQLSERNALVAESKFKGYSINLPCDEQNRLSVLNDFTLGYILLELVDA